MAMDLVSREQQSVSKPADNYETSEQPTRKRNRLSDGVVVFSIALAVIGLFWKTALLGAPISKVARLSIWDSAFAAFRDGTSAFMDPSLVQLTIPYYLLSAKLWHSGHIPLWNQFSGCGVPLLADPQAKVLSPLLAVLSLHPDLSIYNRVLVAELVLAAAGAFLLSRSLGLGSRASILAAFSYTFCPFLDFYLEWNGSAFVFYPMVFWLFTRAARSMRAFDAALAGTGVAAMVLSGHPELTFLGTTFAAFFLSMLCLLGVFPPQQPWHHRVLKCARQLVIAASVAFCLSAPILIPFCQYLMNADCYKFVSSSIDKISWQALALNLLQPAMGNGSLYLGILPVLSLPFCIAIKESRMRRAMLATLITFFVSEAFTARLWPFNLLFSLTPLSTIIPNYGQPAALLMLTIAAAFGFEQVTQWDLRTSKRFAMIIGCTALVVSVPLLVRLANVHLNTLAFDSALWDVRLSEREWRELAVMTLGIAVLLLLKDRWNAKVRNTLLAVCLAASFLSEFREAKGALAAQARFNYPSVACTDALKNIPGRFIATGEHLLKPNTNVVYELSDLRFHNPLFPKRYLNLMRACGARLDGFNVTFQSPLNPLISLASVCRVASLGPVWSEHAVDSLPIEPVAGEWPGVRLKAMSVGYDEKNRQLIGTLQWLLTRPTHDWGYSLAVFDKKGTPLWFSDLEPLTAKFDSSVNKPVSFTREFGVAIPATLKADEALTVGVRIFDNGKAKFVKPTTQTNAENNVYQLIRFDRGPKASSSIPSIIDPQFALLQELPSQIRIYSNRSSCPQAYLVASVRIAPTGDNALQQISSPGFDRSREAVVECSQTPWTTANNAATDPAPRPLNAFLTRKSATEVEVRSVALSPSLLVLTDAYFPGWSATIDGHPATIYRTNYFFRGVFLPAGQHEVVFSYGPIAFFAGSILAVACGIILLAWLCLTTMLKRKEATNPS
jgi:hypothetical protein